MKRISKSKSACSKQASFLEAISISEVIASLREVRGDYIFAMLFLPVALAFQQQTESLFNSLPATSELISSLLIKLGFLGLLLFTYLLEVIAISVLMLNPRGGSGLLNWFGISLLTLAFTLALTVMGFVDKFPCDYRDVSFRVAFVISIVASCGQLCLANWEKFIDKDTEKNLILLSAIIVLIVILILLCTPRMFEIQIHGV